MLEKLKAVADAVKGVLLWIITPIAFFLGIIYYLWTENTELKDKLNRGDEEKKIDSDMQAAEAAEEEAKNAEEKFNRVADAYEREHGTSNGVSGSDSDVSSDNQGKEHHD